MADADQNFIPLGGGISIASGSVSDALVAIELKLRKTSCLGAASDTLAYVRAKLEKCDGELNEGVESGA